MWQTDEPVVYPINYTDVMWNYEQGNRCNHPQVSHACLANVVIPVRDESFQDVANYYARLLSWWVTG